jgi:hypothetical protein
MCMTAIAIAGIAISAGISLYNASQQRSLAKKQFNLSQAAAAEQRSLIQAQMKAMSDYANADALNAGQAATASKDMMAGDSLGDTGRRLANVLRGRRSLISGDESGIESMGAASGVLGVQGLYA